MVSHLNMIMIPFMTSSHIIPMIDMGKVLATHGVNITIVLTPLTAERFSSVINRAAHSGLSIRLLQVPFPSQDAGLPPGCETIDAIPSYTHIRSFHLAITLFQHPVEDHLQSLNPRPSCIICDKHIPWTLDTCNMLQVPRIIFDGMNCFSQLVIHQLYVSRIHENRPPMEPFAVPGLPDHLEFYKAQLPGMFNEGSIIDVSDFRARVRETELQAYGAVVNSFEELEKQYADEYRIVKGGKVWCVGPLPLSIKDDVDRAERGKQASADADRCLKWLDSKNPGSVVYACLGSLSRMAKDQFVELALGLEMSTHPFILVVKRDDSIEEWIREEGFEERVKGRGGLLRGWAPQVLLLSHLSVGGFLTHCGWNSTLEGICEGLPMITWPMFAEQFLNEKLVVEVLGIGVGVGAKVVVHLGEEEEMDDKYKVGRDGISAAVQSVMDHHGKQGLERRKRAKEIAYFAKRSVEYGGSSYRNITLLIEEIDKLINKKQGQKLGDLGHSIV